MIFHIDTKVLAGTDIDKAILEGIRLSSMLRVGVEFIFNGVIVYTHPNSDVAGLVEGYHKAKKGDFII